MPKFEGQKDDNWLDILADYLINSYASTSHLMSLGENVSECSSPGVHQRIHYDFRKIISHDFNYSKIVEATRTS